MILSLRPDRAHDVSNNALVNQEILTKALLGSMAHDCDAL
jgi:hypothetical protein